MTSKIYTKEMADAGEFPVVGMECMLSNGVTYEKATILFVSYKHVVYLNDDGEWCKYRSHIDVKPIDTRTDKEKACDDMVEHLSNEGIVTYDNIMLKVLVEKFIGSKIHGVKWVGE